MDNTAHSNCCLNSLSPSFRDLSTDNLRYLSSRQALADLAHFRTVVGEARGLANRKWVAFGGSYPGSLAAWFRLKYPHLVHAAVATSAPVHATVNFPGMERDCMTWPRTHIHVTVTHVNIRLQFHPVKIMAFLFGWLQFYAKLCFKQMGNLCSVMLWFSPRKWIIDAT